MSMLPRERFGPDQLLLWLEDTSYATNGRAAPTRDAAPPAVKGMVPGGEHREMLPREPPPYGRGRLY